MFELSRGVIALALIVTANATPWLLALVLGERGAQPIDRGVRLADHRRLLGAHKTWRGFLGGTLACGVVGFATGVGLATGLAFGALALTGDAAASFVKRRLDVVPGSEVPVLDQLPEAVLPMWLLAPRLEITMLEIAAVAFTFMVLDLVTVRIRHKD